MKKLIIRLLVNALVIFLIAQLLPGFDVQSIYTAIIVAIVLGLINVTLRPLLIILTLPITIVTLGLFIFILNALLLKFASTIVKGFELTGFLPALVASLIISFVNIVIKNSDSHEH
jgi:putative membrane protein